MGLNSMKPTRFLGWVLTAVCTLDGKSLVQGG